MSEITSNQTAKNSLQDHTVPNHVDTEQAVLAAIMHDNFVFEQVSDFLKSEHFYNPVHQKLYNCIEHLIQRSQVANPITLAPLLKDDVPEIKDYLAQLAVHAVTLSATKTYGKQIHDAFLRRKLIYLGEGMVDDAKKMNLDQTAIQQIERTEQKLFELVKFGDTELRDTSFSGALRAAVSNAKLAFEKDSHIVGVTTGLYDLDKCIGGLHPSDLIIVAGRPSMGKTALAVNIAFNAANAFLNGSKEGAKVVFFSLEMSTEQLAMRLLGQESGIPSDRIRRGAVDSKAFETFAQVSERIQSIPLFIDDTPALTISGLRSRVRRLCRQEQIGLIVIDYLQLLAGGSSHENRVQELSALTRGLKALAKELNVPVIAVSQLSRAVEQREDKHPQLSDLRESGTIEQDADIVMFVYREAYYIGRAKPADGSPKMEAWQRQMSEVHGKATLMIAKQRHGPIKNITLHYNEALTKFGNYSE